MGLFQPHPRQPRPAGKFIARLARVRVARSADRPRPRTKPYIRSGRLLFGPPHSPSLDCRMGPFRRATNSALKPFGIVSHSISLWLGPWCARCAHHRELHKNDGGAGLALWRRASASVGLSLAGTGAAAFAAAPGGGCGGWGGGGGGGGGHYATLSTHAGCRGQHRVSLRQRCVLPGPLRLCSSVICLLMMPREPRNVETHPPTGMLEHGGFVVRGAQAAALVGEGRQVGAVAAWRGLGARGGAAPGGLGFGHGCSQNGGGFEQAAPANPLVSVAAASASAA